MHAQRMPPHITTPFDDSAAMRLRRMGLLTPDGTPDERIIQPLAYVSAGLYYDQLCDSVESHESASGVCQHIISGKRRTGPVKHCWHCPCPTMPCAAVCLTPSGGCQEARTSSPFSCVPSPRIYQISCKKTNHLPLWRKLNEHENRIQGLSLLLCPVFDRAFFIGSRLRRGGYVDGGQPDHQGHLYPHRLGQHSAGGSYDRHRRDRREDVQHPAEVRPGMGLAEAHLAGVGHHQWHRRVYRLCCPAVSGACHTGAVKHHTPRTRGVTDYA